MGLAMEAVRTVLPKLADLLKGEYDLNVNTKMGIKFLKSEIENIVPFLHKVSSCPQDQLDEQGKLWARNVRELMYDLEDIVDSYVISIGNTKPTTKFSLDWMVEKFRRLSLVKRKHEIGSQIDEVKVQIVNTMEQRHRYSLRNLPGNNNNVIMDPRFFWMYEVNNPIGIGKEKIAIISRLSGVGGGGEKSKLKILSIVGCGGIGKTTLARSVFDEMQAQFHSCSFVVLGQNPDVRKVIMDILFDFDKQAYNPTTTEKLDVKHLIDELRTYLQGKRCLLVLDDLWDSSTWKLMKCALPDGDLGNRVITTTRVGDIAKETGDVYEMKPLTNYHSEELFLSRVYAAGCASISDNPPEETIKIIVKKCGGIPLAILTMAGLLGDRPVGGWNKLCNSIGFESFDESEILNNTRKIVSYSFDVLPLKLKACMLHFSMYPENIVIQKDAVIWKWIAEGFISGEGNNLFEVGQMYFNDLINRNLIQPSEPKIHGTVDGCCIHDIVLDFIRSVARRENFMHILDGTSSLEGTVRRIAMHKNWNQDKDLVIDMKHVRSVNTRCPLSMMPSFSCSQFKVLRVLALEGCGTLEEKHLKHISVLCMLRYLGLGRTKLTKLPSEIGNLSQLQTLDLFENELKELPATICKLSKLMRLHISLRTKVPPGVLGRLTSLQELTITVEIKENLAVEIKENLAVELGKLTNLRKLTVHMPSQKGKAANSWAQDLAKSLCSLCRIQCLEISCFLPTVMIGFDDWNPPQEFCQLCGGLPCLPKWVNSNVVPYLSILDLRVLTLGPAELDVLAKMRELQFLLLDVQHVDRSTQFAWTVSGGGLFPKLRHFYTNRQLTFLEGAMPMLLKLGFAMLASSVGATNDVGLGNLPLLKEVSISLDCTGKTYLEVVGVNEAVWTMVDAHPNHPILHLGHQNISCAESSVNLFLWELRLHKTLIEADSDDAAKEEAAHQS